LVKTDAKVEEQETEQSEMGRESLMIRGGGKTGRTHDAEKFASQQ